MIIQEINATVNGNSLSGEVIVPSPVLASTKQTEDGDLTKSPNFKLKLTGATPEMNIIDTVQVEFTNGDFNYTANMNVINKLQNGTVTLQYVDGLTVEEVTHTFECAATEIATSYDLISGDDEVGVTHFLYDGTPVPAADISFGQMNYHNITIGEPTSNDITLTPKTSFTEITTGEFVDTLTATYKGMTTTVTVTLTITKDEPTGPSFTYDGSDKNSPIQVNVELENYPGGKIQAEGAPVVNINFVAPSSDYEWYNSITWDYYQELNSNNYVDCKLLNDYDFDGTWTLGTDTEGPTHGILGYTGPRRAGTYLRSYSVTFTYVAGFSTKYDETTGELIEDPVAQALDGTVITFWVQYNVTGTMPE